MTAGFQRSIGADLQGVGAVAAALDAYAVAAGIPDEVRRALLVVLDDLLMNVVTHGMAGRADGQIAIEATVADPWVELVIRDDGAPFDPLTWAAPDVTRSVEARAIGGLGIHLVRRLMDDVSYRRVGAQNVITLRKRWR